MSVRTKNPRRRPRREAGPAQRVRLAHDGYRWSAELYIRRRIRQFGRGAAGAEPNCWACRVGGEGQGHSLWPGGDLGHRAALARARAAGGSPRTAPQTSASAPACSCSTRKSADRTRSCGSSARPSTGSPQRRSASPRSCSNPSSSATRPSAGPRAAYGEPGFKSRLVYQSLRSLNSLKTAGTTPAG